jgi:pimeloyl-ACP methyl ester carboxylesterase
MPIAEMPSGSIHYFDSEDDGPVVVPPHGLLMDDSLWHEVVRAIGPGYRCLVPTLPLGVHRVPVGSSADLSLTGIARMVDQLFALLEADDVTIVGNDTGGAIAQLVLARQSPRVSRAILTSCEVFDNIPPGSVGRLLALIARLPPWLFKLALQPLRLWRVRRLPFVFGSLTKRGDSITASWVRRLLSCPGVHHDAVRVVRSIMADRQVLHLASEVLRTTRVPVLVAWAAEDRVMPPEHGLRLAGLFPDADFLAIGNSYTLIPLDQPERLAQQIRHFAAD